MTSLKVPRLFIALYTDEDITSHLAPALRRRGYTAQSAAEAHNLGATDEAQLKYATEQGMTILAYNAQDFVPLAQSWYFAGREHAGIVISEQFSQRRFGELLRQVLRFLDIVTADEMYNQILFLQQFHGSS
jgi:predicted nuclease of predicted toxin-antitoxin system